MAYEKKDKISHLYIINPEKEILEVKLRCFDTVFQSPYPYFSVHVKVISYFLTIAI